MLNLLIALVLLLIGICPAAPVAVSLPALCGAGAMLLTWEAPTAPAARACAGCCDCACSRGARGPASGEEDNEDRHSPDHPNYGELAEWVEFNGRAESTGRAGGPGAL